MSLRPVAAAVLSLGVLASGHAVAGEDTTPLSLTVSHQIMRDSNFSKNESGQSETVNTTSAQLGLNKAYGRQNYSLNARVDANRYANNDQLNNDGKNVTAELSSEVLSNWIVRVNGIYDENLNQIQNNDAGSRLVKNLRKYRDGGLTVQYGNGGTWALVGSYDANNVSYEAQPLNDAKQHTNGLKLVYYSSDVLNFGLGGRRVSTNYVNRADLVQTDKNIDFSVNWRATGLSNLSAVLTRRSTDYSDAQYASSTGWGGQLGWDYTPGGLMSYGLNMSRSIGSDRQNTNYVFASTPIVSLADTIATTATADARLQATAKLLFTTSYTLTQYKQDNSYTGLDNSLKSSSLGRSFSVGGSYQVLRSLKGACSYTKYSQTKQESRNLFGDPYLIRPQYDGHAFSCNANFTIDSFNF
ncbi:MAG: hypothetical protein HY019_19825 [Aquabacterium sp.]|uniref:hypothetical protein n=1 Tax=Aquabacterium sp. TaxID=1872578 RepID=UPI0025BA5516|nr:hypothetical protein [Aquabacterium sp.]MBI3384257.1 hypothetical protein [Aquabacterium sp.]